MAIAAPTASAQTNYDAQVLYLADSICPCIKQIGDFLPTTELEQKTIRCFQSAIQKSKRDRVLIEAESLDTLYMRQLQEGIVDRLSSECPRLKELYDTRRPVPKEAFISIAFMAPYNLKLVQDKPELKVWNTTQDTNATILSVIDVRWAFASHELAMAFHLQKLNANLEGGAPYRSNLKIKGAEQVFAVSTSEEVRKTMERNGMAQEHYCFVFVKGSTCIKVFVVTKKGVPIGKALPFAREAAKRTK